MTHKEAYERLSRLTDQSFKIETSTWRYKHDGERQEIVVIHEVWLAKDGRSFEAKDLADAVNHAEAHIRDVQPIASADEATSEFPVNDAVVDQVVS